jgi:hypothetical protein
LDPALPSIVNIHNRDRTKMHHIVPIPTQTLSTQRTRRSTLLRTRKRNHISGARLSSINIRQHNGGELPGDGGVGQYVAKTLKRKIELTEIQVEVLERCTRLSTGEQAKSSPLNMYAQCTWYKNSSTDYPRLTSKIPAKSLPTSKPKSRCSAPATVRTSPNTRQVS